MQNGWYIDTGVFVVVLTHGRFDKGIVLLFNDKYSENLAMVDYKDLSMFEYLIKMHHKNILFHMFLL